MPTRRTLTTFLIGLALGIVLAFVGRAFLGSRLPDSIAGQRESLDGVVTAKQLEGDRLLLTVVTPAGATLVTFKKRVAEIALLVDEGDRITLSLSRYQPFLEDPQIARVMPPDLYAEPAEQMPPDSMGAAGDTLPGADSLPKTEDAPWYD
ncbi:MAG: hypothetical protein JSV86_06375 [Gemmatimonadota bacterium]|nr:MAG: hypothetical protein JSV86_06375 [Gemmatimonadota bacterium]